ncbi:hypothetical protein NUW58_g2290 [Xylaria curta]|uniref:Uncharacterized protein n=1 Tax=Xylaria curta TaxID=42375 RepID=A0ACC1PIA5_9PEZI|nr:hypothetical protein NUW58_g2290 [Xylaria curta]
MLRPVADANHHRRRTGVYRRDTDGRTVISFCRPRAALGSFTGWCGECVARRVSVKIRQASTIVSRPAIGEGCQTCRGQCLLQGYETPAHRGPCDWQWRSCGVAEAAVVVTASSSRCDVTDLAVDDGRGGSNGRRGIFPEPMIFLVE